MERVTGAARFAGGDQAYLRDEQYRDPRRLADRTNLHLRYGTAPVPWFEWVAALVAVQEGHRILEVGCGAGTLWEQEAVETPPSVSLTLCDLSPGMVHEATTRASASGRFVSVTGRAADLQALPFESVSFDRVVANHMLYHLPDPTLGVAELARVMAPDGCVIVATNGASHMRELHEIEAEVFGAVALDRTVEKFGAEVGFSILRQHFADVHWLRYDDELHCTDPADVLAYACSSPPGEDATPEQRAALKAAIAARFDGGAGVMTITKDVGAFTCQQPLS